MVERSVLARKVAGSTPAAAASRSGDPRLDQLIDDGTPVVIQQLRSFFVGQNDQQRLELARALMDETLELAKARAPAEVGASIACGDRCPACCIYTTSVAVMPSEVGRIVDRLQHDGRLEDVERRAIGRVERGAGACPLLGMDGRCTIYDERPLACRRYHSLDRDACEKSDNPTVPWLSQVIVIGEALAALAAGPADRNRDLNTSLVTTIAARLKQARKRQKRAAT
jgi:Fe-S-cluster containining protein